MRVYGGTVTNPPRFEVDGRTATAEELLSPILLNYGHFTAMQVRDGRTRGLARHLARLDSATRELFGTGLDGERVRHLIRHALSDDVRDASVRVNVFGPPDDTAPSVLVSVRPPGAMPETAQSLKSVEYQRPVAHIKHVGGFGQTHYRRVAAREGFDEALLTGPGGVISEGAITNIGFYDGAGIVWPDAPCLRGITMQLLEARLDIPSRRAPVHLADVGPFDTVFVTNSQGLAPVDRIDDLSLAVDPVFMRTLFEAYSSVPWDRI